MKNETLYNKTVDILVQAYFDGTLIKGNCTACAIGNIVGGFMGLSVPKFIDKNNPPDVKLISDLTANVSQGWFSEDLNERLCIVTGYSFNQLEQIENIFERVSQIHWHNYDLFTEQKILEDQFNGLMAVIDVLDIIHENTDTVATKAIKEKFIKQLV